MLVAKDICKRYKRMDIDLYAVKPLTLNIELGKCYALVGESGCGKTTLGNMLAGLQEPDNGEILFNGENIYRINDSKNLYKDVQLVMQNAKASLDPTMKVKRIIAEPLKYLMKMDKKQIHIKVIQLLEQVGLSEEYINRKPLELSGGQQKRVAIARAIAINPKLIIFDEATSGLDVTVKSRILHLLKTIQKSLNCSYFFITHDIASAFYIADTILVMKDGEIVERCNDTNQAALKHDYSRLLVNSAVFQL